MMDENVIHPYLDTLLVLRGHCLRENPNPVSFQRFLKLALEFVRDLMTEEVFRRAMKHGEEGQGTLLFANRVQLLEPLLRDDWPSDFTFDEMVAELYALANGDAPRIFKPHKKRGQFRNAHALTSKKLDAHLWYKVLRALGVKATVGQALIIEHYAVTSDAFQKWRKEAKEKLSADYVERYLVSALGGALSLAAMQENPIAWATEQTKAAGAAYREELARAAA